MILSFFVMIGKEQIMSKSRGFTLIEILIGLALLILLMGVLFSVFGDFWSSRKRAMRYYFVEQGHQIARAVEMHYADYSQWPSSLDDVSKDYLKVIPQCKDSTGTIIKAWSLVINSDGGFGNVQDDVYILRSNKCTGDNNVTTEMCQAINSAQGFDYNYDYNCDPSTLQIRVLVKPDWH